MQRAAENDVGFVLNAGGLFDELPVQLEIATRYPNTATVTGVHPHNAVEYQAITTQAVIENTRLPQVVAIGECGLDYFYDFAPRDTQIAVFRKMIAAAQTSGLPLIVHTRDAESDTAEILRSAFRQSPFTGVIHCYSSDFSVAEAALEIGFYLSASGIITFNKSADIRARFQRLPLEKLLVETDSPYLAPVPFRGKTNEPSFVRQTAKILADIKNVDFETISTITTNNFFKLFTKTKEPIKED
jgi:TatD DNase family protein